MRFLQSLFLAIFTGIGLLGTVAVAFDFLQGVDTYSWQETTCRIESSNVVQHPGTTEYALEVSYRYFVRGEERRGDSFQHGYAGSTSVGETERLAHRYAVGAEVPCWVGPDDPPDAYLLRANLWRGLWILGPLIFVAVGAGSLWFLHGLGKAAKPRTDGIAPIQLPKKSKPFKTVGLMVGFFAVFFLMGAGMFIPFFIMPALQVVDARSWQPTPCEILSSEVRSHTGDDSTTYSVEALYRYEFNGREHQSNRYQFLGGSSSGYDSKAAAVEKIPAGAEITCYVDPDDPFEAVIERGFTTEYFFGLIPLLFALVGAGGIAAVVYGARAIRKDAGRPSWSGSMPAEAPARPQMGPMTLEPAMGRFGKLGCAIVFTLIWNGILAPFIWIVVKGFQSGSPDWFVTIVIIPFVLIGLLLISGIPYSILALVNPKPRVRLSRGALRAGETVQIDWSFVGMASRIRRLKIWLESSKRTTTTVTTGRSASVRTRTEPLETIDVVERGLETYGLESGSVSFTLPEGTRPTSSTGDRAIDWKLKVHGEIAFWPDVLEEYEIQVLPGGNGE